MESIVLSGVRKQCHKKKLWCCHWVVLCQAGGEMVSLLNYCITADWGYLPPPWRLCFCLCSVQERTHKTGSRSESQGRSRNFLSLMSQRIIHGSWWKKNLAHLRNWYLWVWEMCCSLIEFKVTVGPWGSNVLSQCPSSFETVFTSGDCQLWHFVADLRTNLFHLLIMCHLINYGDYSSLLAHLQYLDHWWSSWIRAGYSPRPRLIKK